MLNILVGVFGALSLIVLVVLGAAVLLSTVFNMDPNDDIHDTDD